MAIVEGPALSIDASGNLGPVCFSKWRGVNVARDIWTGTYPGTAKQLAQTALLTTVSQYWGAIGSTCDREAWEEYAKTVRLVNRLGKLYIPTGFGIYMKLNLQRMVWGYSIRDAPYIDPEPKPTRGIYIYALTSPVRTVIRLTGDPDDYFQGWGDEKMQAGPYDSPGRKPIEGEWRIVDIDRPSSYYIHLGGVANKYYWYRVREIRASGHVGNWFVGSRQFI